MARAAKRAKKAATRKRAANAAPDAPSSAPAAGAAAGTTLTLNALESHLWEAANILRGSPLGRTDWMSYILPLLFFKRICDVWDEETAAARELYGDSEFEDFPSTGPTGTSSSTTDRRSYDFPSSERSQAKWW